MENDTYIQIQNPQMISKYQQLIYSYLFCEAEAEQVLQRHCMMQEIDLIKPPLVPNTTLASAPNPSNNLTTFSVPYFDAHPRAFTSAADVEPRNWSSPAGVLTFEEQLYNGQVFVRCRGRFYCISISPSYAFDICSPIKQIPDLFIAPKSRSLQIAALQISPEHCNSVSPAPLTSLTSAPLSRSN